MDFQLTGMIALRPLPGTYDYQGESLEQIENSAISECVKLKEAGFHSIMIQNVNDIPSKRVVGHEIIAYMASIGRKVKEVTGDSSKIGVSILKNEGAGAIAVADAIGADFVRMKVYVGAMVSSEGITEGCIEEALEIKKRINSNIEIWADIYDRSGSPIGSMPLEDAAGQAISKGKADRLIITGKSFKESMDWIKKVKISLPNSKIILGGGATAENLAEIFKYSDGVIIGSSLKKDGIMTNLIDDERLYNFMRAYQDVT